MIHKIYIVIDSVSCGMDIQLSVGACHVHALALNKGNTDPSAELGIDL